MIRSTPCSRDAMEFIRRPTSLREMVALQSGQVILCKKFDLTHKQTNIMAGSS